MTDHVQRRRWGGFADGEDGLGTDCERELGPAFEDFGVALEAFSVDAVERADGDGV